MTHTQLRLRQYSEVVYHSFVGSVLFVALDEAFLHIVADKLGKSLLFGFVFDGNGCLDEPFDIFTVLHEMGFAVAIRQFGRFRVYLVFCHNLERVVDIELEV